jgi:uncharacterized membrane protein (GlpM family)
MASKALAEAQLLGAMWKELVFRFVIGGTLVSAFALIGDLFRPKSFAGLFGAAPSVALATLALTISREGRIYAALEARSMICGAAAFFFYAHCVSWLMMKHRIKGLVASSVSIVLWAASAFGLWFVWLART